MIEAVRPPVVPPRVVLINGLFFKERPPLLVGDVGTDKCGTTEVLLVFTVVVVGFDTVTFVVVLEIGLAKTVVVIEPALAVVLLFRDDVEDAETVFVDDTVVVVVFGKPAGIVLICAAVTVGLIF